MLWATLGYMERYWTLVGLYLIGALLWRLARRGQVVEYRLVSPPREPPAAPAS